MSDEIPLESILPAEAIAKIRNIVRESLSQPAQATVGGGASLAPIAEVIRVSGTGTISVTGTMALRLVNPALLIDPVASKKLWESPLGLQIIQIIVTVLLLFYQEYREDLRDAGTEKFMQVIVKQVEEFVLAHREQSTPTPKPTPDAKGD